MARNSPSRRAAQRYYRRIKEMVDKDRRRVWQTYRTEILPLIHKHREMTTNSDDASRERMTTNTLNAVQLTLDNLREQAMNDDFNDSWVRGAASQFVHTVDTTQRRKFREQAREVIGFDPTRNEPWLEGFLHSAIEENVAYIKSIPQDYHNRIESIIVQGARRGTSLNEMGKEIAEQGQVSLRRGKFIARDQLGSIHGDLTKTRHESLGLKKFRWFTSMDERVRDSHANLHGLIFTWEDGAVNERGEVIWPGTDFNCRCHAEAIPEELRGEVVPDDDMVSDRAIHTFDTEYLHPDYTRDDWSRAGSPIEALSLREEGLIDKAQFQAAMDYNSQGYEYINSYLRHGDEGIRTMMLEYGDPPSDFGRIKDLVNRRINQLDFIMEEASMGLPRPATVWRGVSSGVAEQLLNEATLYDGAYMSTTTDVRLASPFTVVDTMGRTNYIRIEVPRGTPAFRLSMESEIVLHRGQRLDLVSVEQVAKEVAADYGIKSGPDGIRILHCVLRERRESEFVGAPE